MTNKSIRIACCTLAFFIVWPSTSFANDAMKSAVISYITDYFVLYHLETGHCGKQLGNARQKNPHSLGKTLELGRPYMTPKELEELNSGELMKYLAGASNKAADEIIAKARKYWKTDRDVCLFSLGYAGGRREAFRDQIRNMGGPRL